MTDVVRLRVELLTEESFTPFGELLLPQERAPNFRGISSIGWRAHFACNGPPELMVFSSQYTGLRFRTLERHLAVTQAFIPLAGAPSVIAVAPGRRRIGFLIRRTSEPFSSMARPATS